MADRESQMKWRRKNHFVKRQLNVMARKLVHDYLAEIGAAYHLKGKGEAVTFSCYVTKALIQQGEFNEEAARLLRVFYENFKRDRELFSSSRVS